MADITVIILTKDEEIHIRRCLSNAMKFAKDIFVVDSFSTDRTVDIAREMGVKVYQHPFKSHSDQLNWGLKNLPIRTEWVWKQDADEYLSDELIEELQERLSNPPQDVNGFTAPCLRIFMGKYIRHGILPLILLRLFKYEYGYVENRMMDEHIVLRTGEIGTLKNPFYDDNLNGLTWWTNKHNNYATKESIDLLITEYYPEIHSVVNSGAHSASIRKKKLRYIKMPLFWRAFAFFILRYFFRLGFLDGKEGFLWHFLQGFWYRTLADAKVFELKKRFGFDEERIKAYLEEKYLTTINNTGGVILKNSPLCWRIVSLQYQEGGRYAA